VLLLALPWCVQIKQLVSTLCDVLAAAHTKNSLSGAADEEKKLLGRLLCAHQKYERRREIINSFSKGSKLPGEKSRGARGHRRNILYIYIYTMYLEMLFLNSTQSAA